MHYILPSAILRTEMTRFQKVLRIDKPLNFSSEVNSKQKGVENIINIVNFYQCDHYLIFEHETRYIDIEKLKKSGIHPIIKSYTYPNYMQQFEPFEPNMSTLDIILNIGTEARRIIESGIIE